ncbi:MAG: glycine--tRNA ligase subunit beta [Desulfobacterales bacterium]|nr:glycine--tRNA ligase subunit beta [Desulfobacterales bacterium]MBF0396979.1 glycine--tRNA ligase subunit beta [Desulfobacterales bacterium]
MSRLLLEILTEEIPAGYIEPALEALSSILLQKLTDGRIQHGKAEIFGTPRRLAITVDNISEKQLDVATEVIGPPKQAGFDSEGNPTMAAKKFAEKLKISIEEICIKETKKGAYLSATKKEEGDLSINVLSEILPEVIRLIPFPKTMKWASFQIKFARPIISILAILDDQVIPFSLETIKSDRYTLGHRFLAPDKIEINSPNEYVSKLKDAYVLVDMNSRRQTLWSDVLKTAQSVGGNVVEDNDLIEIVNNLVEYPAVSFGKFDTKFTELPKQILITSMREHQKYFAVVGKDNNLMPYFIAVNNTIPRDISLVAKGHERVLRARLNDAEFFYKSDLKADISEWVEKLKGILFQANLGSIYEKILRIREITGYISDVLCLESDTKNQAMRAAFLCKADLVSHVVMEFPKLQGIMGAIYAKKGNESDSVAKAIEEHYMPTYSGGILPESIIGAIVAIADKIDSICGCFSANLIPTGASDPYALRRHGIGIIQIMLNKNFSFSLIELIEKSLSLFGNGKNTKETSNMVYLFLQNRISHLLEEQKFPKDIIYAVTDISVDNIPNVWKKVDGLSKLKQLPDFEQIAIAFKRVVNIIVKKADPKELEKKVDENLFKHESESSLYNAYKDVKNKVLHDIKEGHFDKALLAVASLKPHVDAFFDGVMVLIEDDVLRCNRLALLKNISDLFGDFADFSKIST